MSLKFFRSMTHTTESSFATTVAARGTRYSKASSPKLPPLTTVWTSWRLLSSPLSATKISNFPDWQM
eukprot:Skav225336  [mRNA]  locus=scaffold748:334305:340316:+ [translate_table: standard]